MASRKIVALTIVLVVVATGLLIFQFVRARSTSPSVATISNKSIAVLPFDNLSDPVRGDPRFEALAEKIVPAREFGTNRYQKK